MATLEDYLSQVHVEMQRRHLPEMDDETVRELSKHMAHPEVMQGFQTGKVNAKMIVDEVQAALQSAAEGGPVNDRSGVATQQVRSQLGMP